MEQQPTITSDLIHHILLDKKRERDINTFTKFKYEQRGTQMGSSVRYNRTLEPYLRSRGRENEVINDFCHAPFLLSLQNHV